jgi:hypothetical protein
MACCAVFRITEPTILTARFDGNENLAIRDSKLDDNGGGRSTRRTGRKAHPRRNCDGIEKVYTIPELVEFMIRRPCIYGLTPQTLRRCWIAGAGPPAGYCMVAGEVPGT